MQAAEFAKVFHPDCEDEDAFVDNVVNASMAFMVSVRACARVQVCGRWGVGVFGARERERERERDAHTSVARIVTIA